MQTNVSDEVLEKIAKFFLETSVPRIIAEERRKKSSNGNGESNNIERLKDT